jgi:TonB family protein
MRSLRFHLFASLAVAVLCASAKAQEVKLIANASVHRESISVRQVKSIFLQDVNTLDGEHVEPVLAKGGAAHDAFLKRYLGKDNVALQNHYRSLVFTGRGAMPHAMDSNADMVAYVARTRGAIGYVEADYPADGVKTLRIVEDERTGERKVLTRIEPVYPPELKERGISGLVRLQVYIAGNGTVERIEILGGNPILAEAAKNAVYKWKYASGPASTIEVTIPFDPNH